MNPELAGEESEPRVPTDLHKALAATPRAKARSGLLRGGANLLLRVGRSP